jgi:hypothetical protein
MTEEEWLAATSPQELLLWLGAKRRRRRSVRKNGLFVVACAERVKSFMTQAVTTRGLQVAERMAEGAAGEPECDQYLAAFRAMSPPGVPGPQEAARLVPFHAVHVMLPHRIGQSSEKKAVAAARSCVGVYYAAGDVPRAVQETSIQADLLRDVIGNPFRPAAVDPAWLTPTPTGLATAAYEERTLPSGELDPARLSVLADALEDAGCSDADLLGHLRSPGPHVRGCWALDLILGKE